MTAKLLKGAAALCFLLSFSGSAQAAEPAAMVADVDTGAVLVSNRIDMTLGSGLLARLALVSIAIQDLSEGALAADERIQISRDRDIDAFAAIQATALGEAGYRAPMTALAARTGHNPRILRERISALLARIEARASSLDITRSPDGGPGFEGKTTTRDTVRLAVSLLRAHHEMADEVFEPATGGISSASIWIMEGDACLLAAIGPLTGREMVAMVTNAPTSSACFETTARLISGEDARIARVR